MKKIFFTPGPSQLYSTVPAHIQTAVDDHIVEISHRGETYKQIFRNLTQNLKKLLDIPDSYSIFFAGSATETMERVIENCVETHSFHFVNGAFSKRFYTIAQELKKQPKKEEAKLGDGFDLEHIEIPKETELICFTHNESATGVMIPEKEIEGFKKRYPDMLLAVDIVSSAPYAAFDMRLLDFVFFSVQKGFGLPAGLGVMIVSPNALEKAERLSKKGLNIGSYHNFVSLKSFADKDVTPETPPVLHMYLLEKVIEDMLAIGVNTIREQTETKAKLLYDFLDSFSPSAAFVKDKKFRSKTIIVADFGARIEVMKKQAREQGMIVGIGYDPFKETQIRIANMPSHSIEEIKLLIRILKESK